MLGDKIRNEEAIRPRAVVLLSLKPGAASEKVKLCSRPTVTQGKNKRLLAVKETINSTRNWISSLKSFSIPAFFLRVFFRILTFYIVSDDLFFELIRTRV